MFNFKLQAAMVREFPGLYVHSSGENFVYLEGDGLRVLFQSDGVFSCSWGNVTKSHIVTTLESVIKPSFTNIPTKEDVDKLEKMSSLISKATGFEYPKKELDRIRDRIKKPLKERVVEALNREFPGIKNGRISDDRGGFIGVGFFAGEVFTLDITRDCKNLAGARAGDGLIRVSFNPSNPMTRDTYEKLCKVIRIFSAELNIPYPSNKMGEAYRHMLASEEKERNKAVENLRNAVLGFFIHGGHTNGKCLRGEVFDAINLGMERSAIVAICLSVLSERVLKSCVTTEEKDCAHRAFCEIINL